MPDAGDIKVKVSIEYDPSGVKQAKEDLQSLADVGGSVGDTTASASDGFAKLDEQLAKTADSAKGLTGAMGAVEKPMSTAEESVTGMTEALNKQQEVIDKIQDPMKTYAESVQSVSEAVSGGHLSENLSAFQDALQNPYPFQMIGQYLNETGQNWGDFTSSIGEGNTQMLHEMATNADVTHQVLGGMSSDVQSVNKTFTESAGSAAAFTSQFNGMTEAVGKANEGINAFGGAGKILAGPLEELQSYKSIGFGEAFGNASEGIMGALNNIAMPLMAVQMIGMAVQAVGSAIYSAAAIAEGPAAHSFGTFTGTVDALGQSAAKTGAQFSEGIGQGILPTLNQLNYDMNQGQQSAGTFGQSLGLAGSTLASLWQIGTGQNVVGGLEGLANVGAQIAGVQQPYQGPGPAQQSQVAHQQALANMPETVRGLASQTQTQADQYLQMASDPTYLASQDQLMASQQAYQHAQTVYNQRHYISPQQALMNYQAEQYDTQQNALYNQQSQNLSPYDPIGFWGGVFGGGSGPRGSAIGSLFGGGSGASTSAFDQMMGGFHMSIPLGPASMFSGIGDFFGNLLGGGGVPATTSMGCFPAGTRVRMANGSEKPIETLQIGEKVLACDGLDEVVTTVLALIKPPPKPVFELTFSNGATLTLTDSHPVATPLQGWKALSVEHAKQENPDLPISPLHVGDSVSMSYGICTVTVITPLAGVMQVYNITVAEPHTFYANHVLVHNKMGSMANDGTGSENVSLSHTFTATVNWAATGLEKQFTAAANWIGQGLTNTFQGVANWVAQGLSNTFQGVANWIGQGLENTFQGVANWIGQGLSNTFQGVANWIGQGLENTFQGVANWIGDGLDHLFTGKASWIGQDLEHMFTAVAQWTAQNLNPSFTVNPSVTMLAEGTSNFAGGPAIVGESGPEVVSHNGQYSLFNQGATLLDLPAGASVYPMKNLSSSSVAQFADGTGDGPVIPLTLGGGNAPHSINVVVQLDSQSILSAIGMPMAQNIRLASGLRGF